MATHATAKKVGEFEQILRDSRNATILLVDEALVQVLHLQAKAEKRSLGEVLDAAVRLYLSENADKSVMEYLSIITRKKRQ